MSFRKKVYFRRFPQARSECTSSDPKGHTRSHQSVHQGRSSSSRKRSLWEFNSGLASFVICFVSCHFSQCHVIEFVRPCVSVDHLLSFVICHLSIIIHRPSSIIMILINIVHHDLLHHPYPHPHPPPCLVIKNE